MIPERRGNLFSEEVYRIIKAPDATSTYTQDSDMTDSGNNYLPPNSKFSSNDVILLTLQPQGSGDFFDPVSLPTAETAVSVEARVISTGPTYIDIAVAGGMFEASFGLPANDQSGKGNRKLRLRIDRFFSNVPYTRMVTALTQLTAIPDRTGNKGIRSTNHRLFKAGLSTCRSGWRGRRHVRRPSLFAALPFAESVSILRQSCNHEIKRYV